MKVARRKSVSKRKAAKKKSGGKKRKAAKKKSGGKKRKAAKKKSGGKKQRVEYRESMIPRLKEPKFMLSHPEFTSRAKNQMVDPDLFYEIKFKIDSGNLGKDLQTLNKIIDFVSKKTKKIKILFKYTVQPGSLNVLLELIYNNPVLLPLATMATYDIIKYILLQKFTKTVGLSDHIKQQLVKAALADLGEVDYVIEYGEKTKLGTKYSVNLSNERLKIAIVTEQGDIEWIDL